MKHHQSFQQNEDIKPQIKSSLFSAAEEKQLTTLMGDLVLDSVPTSSSHIKDNQNDNDQQDKTLTVQQNDQIQALSHAEIKKLSEFQKIKNIRHKLTSAIPSKIAVQFRRVPVPRHRRSQLKEHWETIVTTLIKHMKLQVRMNTKKACVQMRTCKQTQDSGAIQKSADFIKAFLLGFQLKDAIALLRLEDLYVDSFDIKDGNQVKTLKQDNLSRCIGRICGDKGKTKFAIQNSTRTRIVIAGSRVHILGSFSNIKYARDGICNLILGSPAGKVYSNLRTVTRRLKEI